MAILIPYVKQSWTDGSGGGTPVSAARLGVIEEGVFDVSYAPAVRVFHNASQSITSATQTALAFNSERIDQAGNAASTMHDTAVNNSRLTCRYAGVYQITGNIDFATSATGDRQVQIFLNNATVLAATKLPSTGGTNAVTLNVTTLYALAVNDFVELRAWQGSGGALNVLSSANFSPEFMMVRVG